MVSGILGLGWREEGGKLRERGAPAFPSVSSSMAATVPLATLPAPAVNAGGGLIGDGHPVGATGVRQVVEACQQLTNTAGDRQVRDVKHFLTFNMGGSVTTNVVMIWGREE